MKAKLIKTELEDYHMGHYFLNDTNYYAIGSTDFGWCKTSAGIPKYKLSKENCDEIFGVVDVGALALEECNNTDPLRLDSVKYKQDPYFRIGYLKGYNKAIELNKDKLFTVEDMRTAMLNAIEMTDFQKEQFRKDNDYHIALDIIQSLQQPKEIEVRIAMGCSLPNGCTEPEIECTCEPTYNLDENGCLTLWVLNT